MVRTLSKTAGDILPEPLIVLFPMLVEQAKLHGLVNAPAAESGALGAAHLLPALLECVLPHSCPPPRLLQG